MIRTFLLLLAVLLFVPRAAAAEPALLLPLDGGSGWVNSKPLTLGDLRNQIVLLDFFDYTSVHSLRTLPYLKEWYKRYSPYGLTIVSIEVPTFGFAGVTKNVGNAAQHYGIAWPIVIDGYGTIVKRYGADFTPHLLLFDHNGFRIASFAGETDYTQIEALIQQIMGATHPEKQWPAPMALLPQDSYDKPNAVTYPITQGIPMGRKGEMPGNEMPNDTGLSTSYTDPRGAHDDGIVYLQGRWNKTADATVTADTNCYLTLHYHAMQVQAVMEPMRIASATVVVTQNGKPVPKEDAGADILYDSDGQSYVTVDAPRAYDLIMNKRWGSYDLRLYPKSSNLAIYAISFETAETGSDY